MTTCIIQARMGSSRFPGKVLKKVDQNDLSILSTIKQIKNSKKIHNIIIATTTLSEDKKIINYLKKTKIDVEVFTGNPKNVLDRYYKCAKKFSCESIVRVTADCPLIDPKILDKGINIFNKGSLDYVTNTFPRTYPDGNETEIFSFEALTRAWKNAKLPSEKEHVTPYFRNYPNKFKIKNFTFKKDISNLRWTVDYPEDLKLVKLLISKINHRPIHLEHILEILKLEPKLIEINKGHFPNEGYLKSLNDDKKLLKK